jgi:RimJ/RimL family protein N-acetyltransferase
MTRDKIQIQVLHDKSAILTFLKKSEELHFYCIGDLDDFYWPKTTWYGLIENDVIQSIALLYTGPDVPTLLMFYDNNPEYSFELLKSIRPILPEKFFAHLSPDLISIFGKENIIENSGLHYKMVLKRNPPEIDDPNIKRLSTNDLPIVENLYLIAYPHNWFDRRMVETDKYFGYFINDNLVGIAGIHVYSAIYKVSALGNIATLPGYRGQQIAFRLTSRLCNDLFKDVNLIGLNVKSDNKSAIRCYEKIGFEIAGNYEECFIINY